MTTKEAVRQALADGVEKPTEIVAFLKEKFGIETTAANVSTTKNGLKKEGQAPEGQAPAAKKNGNGNGGKAPAAPVAAQKAPKASQAAFPFPQAPGLALEAPEGPDRPLPGISLRDLEQIKILAARYGKEGLAKLADLLG